MSEPLPYPRDTDGKAFQSEQGSRPTNWEFGPLKFRADFDSSNLADVIKCTNKDEYDLWIRPDCSGQACETKHRTWFYFGLSGVAPGQVLNFNVVNMNKQSKLFSFDMRPVFFTPGVSEQWEQISESVEYQMVNSGFKISFHHKFRTDKETFFAFCIPFSCTDNERLTTTVENHAKARQDIYFCREILGYSKGGRKIEVLTISSKDGMLDGQEAPMSYPCLDQGDRARAFDKSKKVFVVSSRVHPGETPATHVFNGILAFLLQRDDERAVKLREKYVFKLIPIVNPDGVSLGHYRSDSQGQNLNRFYDDPKVDLHPEIFAVKSLIMYYFEKGDLEVCIDLHAHANRMGSFAYGNHHLDSAAQIETIMYAKLVAMNCPYFDFRSCSFSEKNMSSKDKNGESKAGSNRVALYRATNLVHIYTIETNYSCASLTTAVTDATDTNRTISPGYKVRSRKKFCIESFGQIGKGLLVGILDVKEWNPFSRLKNSEFKNMQILKNWASSYINATLSKKFRSFSLSPRRGSTTSAMKTTGVNGGEGIPSKERRSSITMRDKEKRNSIILPRPTKKKINPLDNFEILTTKTHKFEVQNTNETNENFVK